MKCKLCKKKLIGRLKVYCSRLCQNRWQARYQNGFLGRHHSKLQKKKWSEDRKKTYSLKSHIFNCQCAFCKTVRHETKPPMMLPAARQKISQILKGRKITWKEKVSEGVKKAYQEGRLQKMFGSASHRYVDGRTPLILLIRSCSQYSDWRNQIFCRDKYTCQKCGTIGNIEAHHKKSFLTIFNEFILHFSQYSVHEDKEVLLFLAQEYFDFWDLNNGETLCCKCHSLVPRLQESFQ